MLCCEGYAEASTLLFTCGQITCLYLPLGYGARFFEKVRWSSGSSLPTQFLCEFLHLLFSSRRLEQLELSILLLLFGRVPYLCCLPDMGLTLSTMFNHRQVSPIYSRHYDPLIAPRYQNLLNTHGTHPFFGINHSRFSTCIVSAPIF